MIKNFKKKKNNKGFTLVELLVVIAIIGILAVVAVPALFKNINKANAADVIADISAIKTGVVSKYADAGALDATTTALDNAAIATTYEVQDLSSEATYALSTTVNTATITATVKNDETATAIANKWGTTRATAAENIVTVELLGN